MFVTIPSPSVPVHIYKVYAASPDDDHRTFMYSFHEEAFLDFCHDFQLVPIKEAEFFCDKYSGYWYVKKYLDV